LEKRFKNFGRDYGNVMASGDKRWPSIAVMLASEWQGAGVSEKFARRLQCCQDARIGRRFGCGSRLR
jgi:hypothetical protein